MSDVQWPGKGGNAAGEAAQALPLNPKPLLKSSSHARLYCAVAGQDMQRCRRGGDACLATEALILVPQGKGVSAVQWLGEGRKAAGEEAMHARLEGCTPIPKSFILTPKLSLRPKPYS